MRESPLDLYAKGDVYESSEEDCRNRSWDYRQILVASDLFFARYSNGTLFVIRYRNIKS